MTDVQAKEQFEKHVDVVEVDLSAVALLSQKTGLSQQKIKQIMQKGAVWHTREGNTRRIRRAKKSLRINDQLHLYFNAEILEQACAPAELIADEGDYSVWFKPYGMYSQGSKWGDHCTIYRWAEKYLQPERPAFLVHRLDRATSGLILLAHSKKMARELSGQFERRTIEKNYHARVAGDFSSYQSETLIDRLVDGKEARSLMRCREYNSIENISRVEVQLQTGRKHQIRQHLSALGFPIIGDRLYGGARCEEFDLQLQARFLSFDCPVTSEKKCYELTPNLWI